MEKSPKDMSLYESLDYSEEGISCKNYIFPWKTILWTDIFDKVWGNISLPAFFPVSFFLIPRREQIEKNPLSNSVNQYSKFSHGKTREKILRYQKPALMGMADRWVLVKVKKIYRPSGMWDKLISDSVDVGLQLSNISEVQNFRTRMYDLGHWPIPVAI